jgi:hypothetical protein
MSLSRYVPAAVSSLRQSSGPLTPSSALNRRVLAKVANRVGTELPVALMSFTMYVPALVPLLIHSSYPLVDVLAEKNSRPPTLANSP